MKLPLESRSREDSRDGEAQAEEEETGFDKRWKKEWDDLMARLAEKEKDDGGMSMLRIGRYDTERSKVLKEVLKSAARANLEVSGKSALRAGGESIANLSSRKAGARRSVKQASVSDPSPFGLTRAVDELEKASPVEMALAQVGCRSLGDRSAGELEFILKYSDRRITRLCSSLQDCMGPSTQPKANAEVQRGEAGRADVRVVRRPEEAPGVEEQRVDRSAADFIHKHSRFEQLDSLSGTIEGSNGFEDLRDAFQQRVQYNDALFDLTDHLLTDEAEFRRTVLDRTSSPDAVLGVRAGTGASGAGMMTTQIRVGSA